MTHLAPVVPTSDAAARPTRARDEGTAMILTLMVMALVTVLGTTVLNVTINNLSATRQSEDSARALDAADAGLTQSVARLRSQGVRGLGSTPCTTDGWRGTPPLISQSVPGGGGQTYQTWIAQCVSSTSGIRKTLVTSRGAAGRGVRVLQEQVSLTIPHGLPLGAFGRSLESNGTPDLNGISLFSTGCVWSRSALDFHGSTDLAYNIPAAVHTSKIITDSNGTGANCPATDSKRIHSTTASQCQPATGATRYDQDSLGGPCAALETAYPTYYGAQDTNGDGIAEVQGTKIADDQTLFDLFNIAPDPFTPTQLIDLRAVAKTQGSYYVNSASASSYAVPDPTAYPDAVLYFDFKGSAIGSTVNLDKLATTWPPSTTCAARSLLVVIDNGNASMNGNSGVAATVVLTSRTYGTFQTRGTSTLVGSVFANTLDLGGTANLKFDACSVSNLSPRLFIATTSAYLELDR